LSERYNVYIFPKKSCTSHFLLDMVIWDNGSM
jgi:hypothetical protein